MERREEGDVFEDTGDAEEIVCVVREVVYCEISLSVYVGNVSDSREKKESLDICSYLEAPHLGRLAVRN